MPMNALVVLSLVDEGIAGVRHLGPAGVVGFAVAHSVFLVLLGVLYAGFVNRFRAHARI